MQAIKIVLVGSVGVGKTVLLITYTLPNNYPHQYVPSLFDRYSAPINIDNQTINVALWDTIGGGDSYYDRLRTRDYAEVDVFLICYSIVDPISLDNIESKWVPEVKFFCPQTPIVVVGTKLDLRDDPDVIKELKDKKLHPVMYEGLDMARKVGASGYFECSSRTRKGVTSLFHEAIKIGINGPLETKTPCTIM